MYGALRNKDEHHIHRQVFLASDSKPALIACPKVPIRGSFGCDVFAKTSQLRRYQSSVWTRASMRKHSLSHLHDFQTFPTTNAALSSRTINSCMDACHQTIWAANRPGASLKWKGYGVLPGKLIAATPTRWTDGSTQRLAEG